MQEESLYNSTNIGKKESKMRENIKSKPAKK